jgi:hypothetical protein
VRVETTNGCQHLLLRQLVGDPRRYWGETLREAGFEDVEVSRKEVLVFGGEGRGWDGMGDSVCAFERAFARVWGGRGAELGAPWFDIALPVLAGERRAATLTPVGCRRGEPR